jgi:transcriptional regulator with XRE-family HTH domain
MRRKPERLGEKLLAVRQAFGLSQNGMLRRLGVDDELTQAEWSAYERGVRIPSLLVLLQTADLAGVWMDVLVNDELDLPNKIPARPKSSGVGRTYRLRRRDSVRNNQSIRKSKGP